MHPIVGRTAPQPFPKLQRLPQLLLRNANGRGHKVGVCNGAACETGVEGQHLRVVCRALHGDLRHKQAQVPELVVEFGERVDPGNEAVLSD
jgi:hypothetical protein